MQHSRRWSDSQTKVLTVAAAAAATVWSVGVELTTARSSPAEEWLPDLAVGITLIACGTVAALLETRRPAAMWLLLAGATWFLGNLTGVSPAWLSWIGEHSSFAHRAVLLFAVLIVEQPLSRWLVPVAAASTLAGPLTQRPWGMIAWSGAALACGLAVLANRPRRLRLWSTAALATLTATVASTAALFLVSGSAPLSRSAINLYQAGIAATALIIATGAVTERMRADRLADAVVELALGPAEHVRDLLGAALRDPHAAVTFASVDGWIDEVGRPCLRLVAAEGRKIVDVALDGSVVAQMSCDADVAVLPWVVDAVQAATTLAARNARLRSALRDEAAEMERSRLRLVVAADEQRVGLTQLLDTATAGPISELNEQLARLATGEASITEIVERCRQRLDALASDLRALATGLGPVALEAGDIRGALLELVDGSDVAVELDVDPDPLRREVATALYFVCAEALSNTLKHASATRLSITVRVDAGVLHLSVIDDGCGGAHLDGGRGLRGLADRVATFDGSLQLISPPGRGTSLAVTMRLTQEGAPP